MGLALIILFAAFFLFGGATFVFTWVITKRIRRVWLRHLIRALVISLAFTPTIVPAPELHGSLPMPAAWMLCGMLSAKEYDWQVYLIYGVIPLLVVVLAYWSVATLASYLIKKYPAEE